MKLPAFAVKRLLRIHDAAQKFPYFHLDGYMERFWILGYRSPERNKDNPSWKESDAPRPGNMLYRWLCKNIAIRAHTFLKGDSDRHLHDHPAWSVSVVLTGGYWEILEPTRWAKHNASCYKFILRELDAGRLDEMSEFDQAYGKKYGIHWRAPGSILARKAGCFHRLVLPEGTQSKTLWVMGKKKYEWGFLTDSGKILWREYLGI